MVTNQFQRTELLFGQTGLQKLKEAHVLVVGCGAVGSFVLEALARAGIGKVTIIDGDKVEESNINRQLPALHSTLQQNKVAVLKRHLQDINPNLQIQAIPEFVDHKNISSLIPKKIDFAVDAIDTLKEKVNLILYFQEKAIPFISSMGAAMRTDPFQIKVSSLNQTSVCPLAALLRKQLKQKQADLSFPCVFSIEHPQGIQKPDRQMGSLVTITGIFGLILANEVIKRIIERD